ncbi:MAG: CoA ester lyase [Pseudomonadota bacterium]
MPQHHRPFRSVLYIPGSNPRALDKAQNLPVDAIIFDLEDAVAPEEKVNARAALLEALTERDYGSRVRIVRVNGLDTQWGADDIATFSRFGPEAILLPKVEHASMLDAAQAQFDPHVAATQTRLWAMMETPRGILNAAEIAAHARLEGFVLGTNDLAKDLGSSGRAAMQTSLQLCLLAARAENVICIDGVYNAFRDDDGLRAESAEGRAFGFDGKSLIHPAQIAIANSIFGPTEDEITLARRQIEAFESAQAEGKGVAVLDGKIVENLHVATARSLLSKAKSIAELEG